MNINRRLAQNVSSLLHHTNADETFNSIVAKLVGEMRRHCSAIVISLYICIDMTMPRYEPLYVKPLHIEFQNLFVTVDEHYGAEYEKEKNTGFRFGRLHGES
uniref:Uncharacterized protein n=1 Tax=Photinus pyralis TaxID=7054 RepID=A0A1Y1LWQ6_PHOPY